MSEALKQAALLGLARPLDLHLGKMLARMQTGDCPELAPAAALVSAALNQGHTCLPLKELAALLAQINQQAPLASAALRDGLLASGVVGSPGDQMPLLLDAADRLFFFRLFHAEQDIAQALRERASGVESVDVNRAKELLQQLFPPRAKVQAASGGDRQKTAAALALLKRFVLITGGPGTGKTYTVARMLAACIELAPQALRIGLCAPTGRAAFRLGASIQQAKTQLPAHLAAAMPSQAQTLHRLLGFQPKRESFLYHRTNPLPLDLLIVDEASMVDTSLMAALMRSLPAACRLILVGDAGQLAPVEAGSLLPVLFMPGARSSWSAPLCKALDCLTGESHPCSPNPSPMGECVVQFEQPRRFDAASGIYTLAQAIDAGQNAQLSQLFARPGPGLRFEMEAGKWWRCIDEALLRFYGPLLSADDVESGLALLQSGRLLCALREGPWGVEAINSRARRLFQEKGLMREDVSYYRGLPIMIERNDYALGLFNGDMGLIWPDKGKRLAAWFVKDASLHAIALSSLPRWRPAYAMTVHKAQGSEFDSVLLLLADQDSPILSRELMYTGITRAKKQLTIASSMQLLQAACARRQRRFSGMAAALHGV